MRMPLLSPHTTRQSLPELAASRVCACLGPRASRLASRFEQQHRRRRRPVAPVVEEERRGGGERPLAGVLAVWLLPGVYGRARVGAISGPAMAQQNTWEADKMLDVYIYDNFVTRNLQETVKAFQSEEKVSSDPVAIDALGGFLFEWWSVFWDIFISRTNEKHSDVAASYIEGLDQLRSGFRNSAAEVLHAITPTISTSSVSDSTAATSTFAASTANYDFPYS